jgi:hypothetical protein
MGMGQIDGGWAAYRCRNADDAADAGPHGLDTGDVTPADAGDDGCSLPGCGRTWIGCAGYWKCIKK